MNEIEIASRYLYKELTELLEIPVYNDLQENIDDPTYCVFFILSGEPIKYVSNLTAFTEFDVRINIWSNEFDYLGLEEIIDHFDGVQGAEVVK